MLLGGGNLINLTTNCILSLCLLLFAGCANAATDKPPIECAISAIGEETIAKVHYKQRRFFVVRNKVDVETLTPLIKEIENCLAKHEWSMKWSLSVFAEKSLAGYKDEPAIIPFHADNQWAKGYLAEYDSKTRTLTLFPVVSPRIIRLNGSGTP